MKIVFSVERGALLALTGIVFVALCSLMVYAYGTSSPAQFGHSSGEVDVKINSATMNFQQAVTSGTIKNSSSQGFAFTVTRRDGASSSKSSSVSCLTGETLVGCSHSCSGGGDNTDSWPSNSNTCTWAETGGSHSSPCVVQAFCMKLG